MKTYKRNKGLTLLSALMSLVLMFLLLGIIYYFVPNAGESRVFLYAVVVLLVLFLLIFVPSLKEKVTVTDTAFILKGFRVKDRSSVELGKKTPFGSQGSDPGKEIVVPYSTVTRLELSRDILFWRCNLRILADDFYQPALIGCVMCEHKQLFSEITQRVKEKNPNAFIDPKIGKYLG
ncbi:MAG: hypothetical protein IIW48_00805 [Clostridia bacterium]|nr:hypothetical protein [Clostridia bacterium]